MAGAPMDPAAGDRAAGGPFSADPGPAPGISDRRAACARADRADLRDRPTVQRQFHPNRLGHSDDLYFSGTAGIADDPSGTAEGEEQFTDHSGTQFLGDLLDHAADLQSVDRHLKHVCAVSGDRQPQGDPQENVFQSQYPADGSSFSVVGRIRSAGLGSRRAAGGLAGRTEAAAADPDRAGSRAGCRAGPFTPGQ